MGIGFQSAAAGIVMVTAFLIDMIGTLTIRTAGKHRRVSQNLQRQLAVLKPTLP